MSILEEGVPPKRSAANIEMRANEKIESEKRDTNTKIREVVMWRTLLAPP